MNKKKSVLVGLLIAIVIVLIIANVINKPYLEMNSAELPAYLILRTNQTERQSSPKLENVYTYIIRIPFPGYHINTEKYLQAYGEDVIWIKGKGPDTSYTILTNSQDRFIKIRYHGLLKEFKS